MSYNITRTKYIVEYIYDEDTEWRFQDEFEFIYDAQRAYTDHIAQYNFIRVRVRKVEYIEREEESIVGEYAPLEAA